jgi:hypothetical protein
MKRSLRAVLVVIGLLAAHAALAAVTVRYHNADSADYKWEAVCSGSKTTVEFGSSRTASATIQGSGPCVVHAPGGDVTLKGDESIEIKGGKVTVN